MTPVLAAVFGDPVAHSLSPAMHAAAFRATGVPGVYMRFRVRRRDLAAALRGAAAMGFRGVNLTIPLKEAAVAIPFVRLTPAARRIGAVNTITFRAGRCEGDSTDGAGFLRSLREAWGFRPRGTRAVVLGAGGAARSVAFALADAGARRLVLVNRTRARARRLASDLERLTRARVEVARARPDWRALLAGADLLVNATSVGMRAEPSPVPAGAMSARLKVADLVYAPSPTGLLRAAKSRGGRAIGGAGMLVHQGGLAFERWTGRRAPVAVMRRALHAALRRAGRRR